MNSTADERALKSENENRVATKRERPRTRVRSKETDLPKYIHRQ